MTPILFQKNDNRQIEAALTCIQQHGMGPYPVALVLGSGFGPLVDVFAREQEIPYEDIPGFPVSTVQGHAGRLILGSVGDKRVVVMQGRCHCYEGYSADQVTFPVRVFHRLGVSCLILTNAAGGIRADLQVGDLMVLTDQINWMGRLLRFAGQTPGLKPVSPYCPQLRRQWCVAAQRHGLYLQQGVLAATLGPMFETEAEIEALHRLGADAVTMSTIPEATLAAALGLRVVGLSCISNLCVGRGKEQAHHVNVMAAVRPVLPRLGEALTTFLQIGVPRWTGSGKQNGV